MKMYKHILRGSIAGLIVAVVVTLPATATLAQEQQEQENLETAIYPVRNVSLSSASTLAESICMEAIRSVQAATYAGFGVGVCHVSELSNERALAVTGTAEQHARIATMLADFDRMPETKAFHVVVLSAGTDTTDQDLDLPSAARQALSDFAEFMPYSSFDVLGSGLLRTSRYAETTLPGPVEFEVSIHFREVSDPQAPVLIESFNIVQLVGPTISESGQIVGGAERRQILGTTFAIEPGETVVVGTSKLAGDNDAVVVLLTAIQN